MTEKVLLFVFGKRLSILSIAFLILLVTPLNSLYSQTLQPSPDSVPAQGLVAYYPFNGNTNDESGNGHDGVVNGAILAADRCGNANSAFKFNGNSDYIDIGEFGEMNDLSISMWFRSDSSNQNSITFGSSTSNNTIVRLNLRFNDVSSRFYYLLSTQTGPDNELYGYVEGIPNDQNWHHFVFTRSGNSIAFFLDGQQRSITAVHAANIQSVNTHKNYFLGADNGDDPSSSQRYYFNGRLDDIRVYNRSLTETEIQILCHLPNCVPNSYSLISPPDADLVKPPIAFNWQTSIDPGPDDTVRYDLYLSRSTVFAPESTIVKKSLQDTIFTDSLGLKRWYWKVKAYDQWGAARWSNQTWGFYVYQCGDCNGDGKVNLCDVAYLVKYLFGGGPAPKPLNAGDVNCDGQVNYRDVLYLIRYIFTGGPKPCQNCP